ncbi:MAG: prolyl oligopeptidase family serine peptidase [Acidobacteriia bacterium]|nr:prolyl oligopeptidase family serine peptidase [Terriglobia bacterium]
MKLHCELKMGAMLAMLAGLLMAAQSTPAQMSTGKEAAESIATHGYVVATKAMKGSAIPAEYTLVLTRDEIYVPIIIRKPEGPGPFPAITMGWGEGREGMKKVEDLSERLAAMQERMLARGYVVATVNYRNEIPYEYEHAKPPQNLPDSISGERRMLKSGPTLDHEDLIAIIRYLQSLPYVDKNGVGAMGVSHSGEMILKASSEYTFGAGVCIEPAAHEFLTVDTGPTAPRKDNEIQFNDIEVVRKRANKAAAMERIRRMHTPILIFGRETDHQQGVFKLTYEWMKEAGKDVSWQSFDHPVHGYVFIFPQKDGSYKPDEIQAKTFELFMEYFDKHLKHTQAAAR